MHHQVKKLNDSVTTATTSDIADANTASVNETASVYDWVSRQITS